jgi:hypothetical protein
VAVRSAGALDLGVVHAPSRQASRNQSGSPLSILMEFGSFNASVRARRTSGHDYTSLTAASYYRIRLFGHGSSNVISISAGTIFRFAVFLCSGSRY